MKIGDYVSTPRFCTVKINAIFADENEARKCGYTEPTYYSGNDYSMAGSLPQEVQDEQNEIAKELLVWFTANVRWIAAHEGEQGIERFRQEIKDEIKNT